MAPTRGKRTRQLDVPVEFTDCDGFALCVSAAVLGWTAINPCFGCAGIAMKQMSEGVVLIEPLSASPAPFVTADVFEALLNQVSAARQASTISSR